MNSDPLRPENPVAASTFTDGLIASAKRLLSKKQLDGYAITSEIDQRGAFTRVSFTLRPLTPEQPRLRERVKTND